MTGKGNRNKGLNYERKIRRELIKMGFTSSNTSQNESRQQDDHMVDLCNTVTFNIQCKAVERGINYSLILADNMLHCSYKP